MTVTETEIVARITKLEAHVLEEWVLAGWLRPTVEGPSSGFDDMDVARVYLLCDLRYEMGLADQEIGMVLSLIDQLHGARRMIQAMSAAIEAQPERVRNAIASHVCKTMSQRA